MLSTRTRHFKALRKPVLLNPFHVNALKQFPDRFGQTISRGGLEPV